ncbi:hypothetical protein NDU88_013298 [Pleurodeles waltl]|uniref:Uncharacterized protein n=1 Tax=Pleurodeles waltl TaxID=8319 RepID=A0AAV7R2P3_PLEWA|nr:hypothetical protein NDU88_013298 [Pleurodeles waltl]
MLPHGEPILPAVVFSRAPESEERRRLKAAEQEDVTAAVPVLDRNKRPQIFTTLLTVFSQHTSCDITASDLKVM